MGRVCLCQPTLVGVGVLGCMWGGQGESVKAGILWQGRVADIHRVDSGELEAGARSGTCAGSSLTGSPGQSRGCLDLCHLLR